jgi:hypothetical protein
MIPNFSIITCSFAFLHRQMLSRLRIICPLNLYAQNKDIKTPEYKKDCVHNERIHYISSLVSIERYLAMESDRRCSAPNAIKAGIAGRERGFPATATVPNPKKSVQICLMTSNPVGLWPVAMDNGYVSIR